MLDPAQRAVAELAADASATVAGAPGSGKTTVIVERVRHLLANGVGPDELLVLTPTRQSATVLRDRLALEVRVATPGPLARSIAAFAYQLVRAHAVHEGRPVPQLLTGPDEDRIVQDLLDGDAEDETMGLVRWPPGVGAEVRATRGFRAELRAFLAECTALGIDPPRLVELAGDGSLPASTSELWRALASFADDYHAVRARMRDAHRDAAGLVREAAALLRALPADSPARGVTARVRVLLVDDAQELTLSGVEMLEACRAAGIAVLVFGDPDVGSGAFRGARPENFARLASGVPLMVLGGCHRGGTAVRDLAAEVTSRIGAAGVVSHRRRPNVPQPDEEGTVSDPDDSIRAFALRSSGEEYDTVARLLRERHIHDGVAWERCAVIAHDSRQVAAFEAELAAREVPTASGQGRTLGENRAVRDLLRLVELAARRSWESDETVEALRAGGFDVVDVRRLRTALRQDAVRAGGGGDAVPAVRDLLASGFEHPLEFELVDTREGRRAARIAQTIAQLRAQLDADATAHELLWTAWERSGWERTWREAAAARGPLAEQARRDLDAIVSLFQAAKRHGERADGTAPVAFLRGILESDVAEDRLVSPAPIDVVQVLTPAAALGTEFDTVVIAGVQDGLWPNLRTRGGLFDTWRLSIAGTAEAHGPLDLRRAVLHDELRLFVRSVTRASERLIVTAVDDDDTGPSVLFEFLPPAEPAPRSAEHPLSLRGLVARYRRVLTVARSPSAARDDAARQLALLAAAGVAGAAPDEWYGVRGPTSAGPLYDLDHEAARVSPSKLEAIAECQLNWVIGDLGGDAGGVGAGLGTLIHAALEHASGSDEAALWAAVEARWSELEFEAAWIERTERVRARDLVSRLSAYLADAAAGGTTLLDAEPHFEIDVSVPGAALPAVISGTIDRVEQTATGAVVIVDLKTGRTQATGPGAALGNPQLSAYQLAFERGAVPGTEGRPSGGAKLLVLKPTRTAPYATPTQPPFDDETRDAFLARIEESVRVMGGAQFLAPFEAHCRDDHTHGLCRIHTIGPVSSS
ncbi:DNA helicase [Microbacterium dextranolyticum]|uniref:DNA 3'-5' helicase n=2 Tax=Microbacterium dextranolyticum TaxID=36806 RepID=A0A9W6HN89_9MICO|nr:DNA helicase [Microbacterium dextranolyticum]